MRQVTLVDEQRAQHDSSLWRRSVVVLVDRAPVGARLYREDAEAFALPDDATPLERDALLDLRLAEFGHTVGRLRIRNSAPWAAMVGAHAAVDNEFALELRRAPASSTDKEWTGQHYFDFESLEWAKEWSVSDVFRSLSQAAREVSSEIRVGNNFGEGDVVSIVLELPVKGAEASIANEIDHVEDVLQLVFARAFEMLSAEATHESIMSVFNFPESIKTACEQYLLYFAQFLRDLGIDAEASVKEAAGQVLFTVRPVDGRTALDQIHQALAVYLDLPTSDALSKFSEEVRDVAVDQLRANVLHLQGQLALAQAIVQMKDATISLLQSTNAQLMSSRVAALNAGGEAADERESLVPFLSVKRFSLRAIEIDAPELLRALKRRFKK